ncbi:MAG: hypothetical protein EOP50_17010, partial [Sphingobacteriales bacterium]
MSYSKAKALLNELIEDPVYFSEQGKSYRLLQEYFKGFPLDTLKPLLKHEDLYVQSAATFILSELGRDGCQLITDVIPLLKSGNLS